MYLTSDTVFFLFLYAFRLWTTIGYARRLNIESNIITTPYYIRGAQSCMVQPYLCFMPQIQSKRTVIYLSHDFLEYDTSH